MECFNELLLKLREVHEREVEGWQVKVQELSNKKGCDSKRMEELFTRNQQMKEQQRLLTENIKTLENRLRAGLCDRCTVTQEVAKRKQLEFEASQLQSLQHLSLLAAEINNLNKENKRLREDLRTLKATLDRGHSDLSSSSSSSSTELKTYSPTDQLGPSGPVALTRATAGRASSQPADGDIVLAKCDTDQRAEEAESRHLRESNQSHFDLYKPLLLPNVSIASTWKTDHISIQAAERRVQSAEGLDQRSSKSPQVLLKNSSSLMGVEVKPSRHVLHAPVPCHAKPSRSVPLTWPRPESSDWVTAASAGTNSAIPPSPRLGMPCFNTVMPLGQQVSVKKQAFSHPWQKQSSPQAPAKEPTVLVRLSHLPEYVESHSKSAEEKESLQPKAERALDERLRDACDAPLDLSDRGKSKSGQPQRGWSPSALQGGARGHRSPDDAVKADPTTTPVSSPSPVTPSPSSWSPEVKQEPEPAGDNDQEVTKEQEQGGDVNGKTNQSNEKKVPVLTISLRPVVVLESLNSALQKQDALSSNGKQAPAEEPVCSADERDEEGSSSGPETTKNGKKKKKRRMSAEAENNGDSDTDDLHREKKIKIPMRAEKNSPC